MPKSAKKSASKVNSTHAVATQTAEPTKNGKRDAVEIIDLETVSSKKQKIVTGGVVNAVEKKVNKKTQQKKINKQGNKSPESLEEEKEELEEEGSDDEEASEDNSEENNKSCLSNSYDETKLYINSQIEEITAFRKSLGLLLLRIVQQFVVP
ncbi:hypothetical protein R6Q59_004540 [Mikania micrantha]